MESQKIVTELPQCYKCKNHSQWKCIDGENRCNEHFINWWYKNKSVNIKGGIIKWLKKLW